MQTEVGDAGAAAGHKIRQPWRLAFTLLEPSHRVKAALRQADNRAGLARSAPVSSAVTIIARIGGCLGRPRIGRARATVSVVFRGEPVNAGLRLRTGIVVRPDP